jgi:DNA-directed RNA polymerase beta subunit
MKKEKPLSENQKLLMSLSGQESCQDWRDNLTNERLRLSRVLIKKLIRANDRKTLEAVAEYYGVHLKEEDNENRN